MPDSPFTTIGDEPVEARIVAWVLGEASAFEAAELERLCDERPELMIFKRRMVALHGMLAEAEKPETDNSWKLSPGKRIDLVNQIDSTPAIPETCYEPKARRSAMRNLVSIAACLILTVIILGLSAPMVIRQRKKSDVAEARSRKMQMELAAMEDANEMQPLRTNFPAELVEGTPKPMNVPNLEGSLNGPAGSATWSSDGDQLAQHKKRNAKVLPEPAAPPMTSTEPPARRVMAEGASSSFVLPESEVAFGEMRGASDELRVGDGMSRGGGLAQREPRPRVSAPAKPSEMAMRRNSGVDPFSAADEDASGSRLPARKALEKSGAGSIEQKNIGGMLSDSGLVEAESAGEKLKQAEVASEPSDIPVLGSLFSNEEKSDSASESSLARNYELGLTETRSGNGTFNLSGGNTYPGGTTVTGGALGVGGSSGLAGKAPAPSATPLPEQSVLKDAGGFAEGDATRARLLAGLDSTWEDSSPADKDVRDRNGRNDLGELSHGDAPSIAGGGEGGGVDSTGKLAAGGSGHIFRGLDIGRDKINTPNDAEGIANATERQQDMQKALEEINTKTAKVANVNEVKQRAEAALEADPTNAEARQVLNMISELKEGKEQEKPKPKLTDLVSEIPATQEPYSTFSLNISDASFKVAQAALAKGEQPDPAGIKVEQFYNAVDYGDPAPAAGEPVSCAIEQAAHPVIPGRNLVRVALKTAAAGRAASQPLRLTLLVDQSGSMVREDRRTAMNKALAGLSELLTGNDIVTVIGFSRTPRLLADGMPGDKAGKLSDLVNAEASEGGTNLEEAIKLGEKMAERRKLAGAQNRIVLFTDGAANLGNADPERLAENVKQLRQKGIAFDIAGIAAEDLNDELLGELARNGNGRYYVVGKGGDDNFAKQLAGAFRPAAENVKVQVRFNPERVGRYKLIGFEKDRLKTEDFRNDKVDAAELAAEEAGVAIYQIETLPEGHGELGEVSVRFRDTAKNEMVERTWTISHDSGAPAIDRATPSMQLATLAMLAGEKLKGGPLADAIDFNQLTAPAANVKQLYGNTGRVAEMLRMVDALK